MTDLPVNYKRIVLRALWACLFLQLQIANKVGAVPAMEVGQVEIELRNMVL